MLPFLSFPFNLLIISTSDITQIISHSCRRTLGYLEIVMASAGLRRDENELISCMGYHFTPQSSSSSPSKDETRRHIYIFLFILPNNLCATWRRVIGWNFPKDDMNTEFSQRCARPYMNVRSLSS